jgi:hypothetical protein
LKPFVSHAILPENQSFALRHPNLTEIELMKTLLTGIFAGAILCGVSLAQNAAPAQAPSQTNDTVPQNQPNPAPAPSAPSSSAPASGAVRIAPGSVIPVQLTKTIDAKKAKTGDEVEAKVTQDLKTQSGQVVVPKDTRVLGHVTEAQARNKQQTESQVGIAFDHAMIQDRGNVSLPMSIQAIIAPSTLNPNNNVGESAGEPAATASPGMSQGSPGGMPGTSGRSAGTGGGGQPPTPEPAPGSESPSGTRTDAHPPITGNTQGVVGISNLTLAPAENPTQGSIVSSGKNNVKLESGTLMLLRVNQ